MAEIMDAPEQMGPKGLARFEASLDADGIDEPLAASGKASVRTSAPRMPPNVGALVSSSPLPAATSIRTPKPSGTSEPPTEISGIETTRAIDTLPPAPATSTCPPSSAALPAAAQVAVLS